METKDIQERPITRKAYKALRVLVNPDEEAAINSNAEKVGMKTAAFLRALGLGHQVTGIIDQQAVLELAKINGDLGRLGGLLKMWLANDERLEAYGKDKMEEVIAATLKDIGDIQKQLKQKVSALKF